MISSEEMTVLIVDDMPSVTKFIHKMMKNIGYGKDFLFANSGREALTILNQEKIDLMLLDYNMPEMSGSELLSTIRSDRKLRDLPIVMITAEAYSDFVAEIGESEVDAYILKPITMNVLHEKIACVLEKVNNPSPMLYHLKRAKSYEDEGDIDSAIQEAHLAMEADPHVTRPIRELGCFYYKKEDLEEAEKWFLKAARLNDLDVFAFHYLGEIYLKQKNIEKAALYLDKAMKISPRHVSRGIRFGKTLIQMGIISKATEVFDRTLELSGSTPWLREEIIDFCFENKVYEYATKLLETAVAEHPERGDLLFKLGQALEKLGEISRAVPHLIRASKIEKEHVNIRIHLAKDYLLLQKPLLAERPLREIINSNPDNELAKELLKQCL